MLPPWISTVPPSAEVPKSPQVVCCKISLEKVEVALSGVAVKEENTEDVKPAMKVLPPWMIKQGMNLTNEQRGDLKSESKMDPNPVTVDEKKPKVEKDDKSVHDEFIKAYYEALSKRQEEQEAAERMQHEAVGASTSNIPNGGVNDERQVGMKSKREDDDDVEWEEDAPTGDGASAFKLGTDLNVQADPAEEEDDDEIDWEEG